MAKNLSLEQIKKLRTKTKAGVMDCRSALEACGDDLKKAEQWLREKGIKSADKRSERETTCGIVEAYTHGEGKIVALVELCCETDFVARTPDFKQLAHDLAMQVAAMNPKDTAEFLKQSWIKDESLIIGDLVKELSGKTGEKIQVGRIFRLELGKGK